MDALEGVWSQALLFREANDQGACARWCMRVELMWVLDDRRGGRAPPRDLYASRRHHPDGWISLLGPSCRRQPQKRTVGLGESGTTSASLWAADGAAPLGARRGARPRSRSNSRVAACAAGARVGPACEQGKKRGYKSVHQKD